MLRIKVTEKRFTRRGRYEGSPPPIPSYPLLSLHLLWLTDNIPSITTISSNSPCGQSQSGCQRCCYDRAPQWKRGCGSELSQGCHQNPVLTQGHELHLGEGGGMGMKCICSIIYAGCPPPKSFQTTKLAIQYLIGVFVGVYILFPPPN